MSLAVHDVHVRLGRRPVLRGITLALQPGEVLAVVGPNGAGKSTLLRVLAGDLAPGQGRVTLDGVDLHRVDPRQVARRRAVLSQKPTLGAAFRVREVVGLGRHPHGTRLADDEAAVERALVAVGMEPRADDPYTRLSGGEQQRVMLARVLAQLDVDAADPRLLLLDEPTSALDLAWQHRALGLARQLARDGAGVLVVLHDLALAATWADRAALLVDGRLVGVGEPSTVLAPEALARAYGVTARWLDLPDGRALPVVTGLAADAAHPHDRRAP